ncbi:hypothetical protein DRF65_22710 [Chryseobacterium pennae]|uniref:VCBS repeat-containing protein n=1 Tax=Chryseobacterium pennae TaxID=2258962 RepID=A0A3D9C2B1_9FLAO|nr:hypothetical protein [Chryseobacterium pennae]REC60007.1 hypothetical protein DRF65_22710 [Chryseobacterium pennae]
MKTIFCFLFLVLGISCFAQKEFQPKGSVINEIIDGDLDGDRIPEKVIVYDIPINEESGNAREIQILKKVGNKWTVLEKSRNAILGSKDGGVMGDPYVNTTIKNGILIIKHYGGSSWRWADTDKYRFQNRHFELIGNLSESGRVFEFWKTIDFNLSTGQIIYTKTVENTKDPENGKNETEKYVKKGIKINLQNRNDKSIKIILPKTRQEIFI